MAGTKPEKHAPPPWQVPLAVADVPEEGAHFDLVADAEVRAAVARIAGLRDLPRLEASFDVRRRGADGLLVQGTVTATVGQSCVVTLEPVTNEVEEKIELEFEPAPLLPAVMSGDDPDEEGPKERKVVADLDAPEPLVGGRIDLGALATEFLLLTIDPYPRKPGTVFEPPRTEPRDPGPFAALAKLSKH